MTLIRVIVRRYYSATASAVAFSWSRLAAATSLRSSASSCAVARPAALMPLAQHALLLSTLPYTSLIPQYVPNVILHPGSALVQITSKNEKDA